jgi:tRNA(fMet)-specific endonuclease VapC
MSFLIDTDTLSAHLRGVGAVTSRFLQYTGRLYLSAVSVAEIKAWLYQAKAPKRFVEGYLQVEGDFELIIVDETVAETAGRISAKFHDVGQVIGTPDALIAATALAFDLTLVTHNTRDFAGIQGLRIADWLHV